VPKAPDERGPVLQSLCELAMAHGKNSQVRAWRYLGRPSIRVVHMSFSLKSQRGLSLAELGRTSLIGIMSRSLLRDGRAYAAFTGEHLGWLDRLAPGDTPVLDPTSGYGLLANACQKRGIDSYCIEMNPPQYLWQVLCLPEVREGMRSAVSWMLAKRRDWPKGPTERAAVSADWLPPQSIELLCALLDLGESAAESSFQPLPLDRTILSAALITPFASRLASCVPGDITHLKRGGMCVYLGWRDDLATYLRAVLERLDSLGACRVTSSHAVVLADSRAFRPVGYEFKTMLTSPPYPNRVDYSTLFAPENVMLKALAARLPSAFSAGSPLLGTNRTQGVQSAEPTSSCVLEFLDRIRDKRWSTKKQQRDETGYYHRYYSNYFGSLEELYRNTAGYVSLDRFNGFIVIRDNTHHGVTVPAADATVETWRSLGFEAKVVDATEVFHVGTKNPRARGVRAKHKEYVIEVCR
jgi:hypothetical protein